MGCGSLGGRADMPRGWELNGWDNRLNLVEQKDEDG